MTVLFTILTLLIGLVLGGFLERFAYAFPRGSFREIAAPRCHSCGAILPRKVSIPLIGGFLSRFRCPLCGERRGVRILVSELVFGVALLTLNLVYDFRYSFFVYAILAAVLLVLSLIDLDIKEAPHSLLLAVLILGVLIFVFSFFSFKQTDTVWWEHLVGAAVISVPLFILMMATGGIGGGDVKLMFCVGLLLGFKLTLLAFMVGVILAALCAVVLTLAFGKGGKFQLPLIPFLSVGTMTALLCGEQILAFFF